VTDVVLPGINGRSWRSKHKIGAKSQGFVHDGLFPERHQGFTSAN
jgi:hypothetical protein